MSIMRDVNVSERGKNGFVQRIRTLPCEQCSLCGANGLTIYRELNDRIFDAPGVWNLRKCSNKHCGLLWLDPMPLKEDILVAYQDYYTHGGERTVKPPSVLRRLSKLLDRCYLVRRYGYGEGNASFWQKLFGFFRSFQPIRSATLDFTAMYLRSVPGGRLLEIGCGAGDNLKALQELGWSVEGVDFDPKAVEQARGKGFRVLQGAFEEHNYPDNCFDAVIMSHLVEHVHEPLRLLRECRRVLRPDGHVVVVTPNACSLGHRLFSASWLPLDPPRHLHLFSFQTLSALAVSAGFQNCRLCSTVRQANGVFMASRDIKRTGRHVWGGVQSWPVKKIAKGVAFIEWACLAFLPLAGEEIVLIAKK